MIASMYYITLIVSCVLYIYILDNLKIKDRYRPYLEGFIFGIIAAIGINIHYKFIEPTAIFPRINLLISHSFLVAISFFLFGYKAGLITLGLLLPARINLSIDLLSYSLVLIILSAFVGLSFNLKYNKIYDKPKYHPILLFALIQIILYTIFYFVIPKEGFSERFYSYLIFLIPVSGFFILLITMGIYRTRVQRELLLNLKYEDALLTNVIYNLSEALIILDNSLNILRINNLAEKLLGYKSEEIINKNITEICKLKDEESQKMIMIEIGNLSENQVLSYNDISIFSKDAEEISIDCKISYIYEKESKQKVYLILLKDIRELKKSKRIIEDSEKRFRQFLEFSLEGIWRYDIKVPVDISLPPDEQIKLFFEHGYLAECNDVFAKMYGFESKNDLIGIPLSATLVPDDENNIEYLRNFIRNNYRLSNAESIEKDKFGNVKYFINSLYGIVENGFIVSAWGIQIDVTEDKLTTKQIRDNNRLLLSILNAPKGIIIFSLDKNYCYTAFSISHKETMKKIWGVDIEIGMNMLEAIKSESDRLKAKNNFDKVLKGEYLNLVEEYGDENLIRSFWLDNYSPIFDGSEIIGIAVYVTDISQQKEFEAELAQKNLLLKTLINTIPDSIYVKDKNLRRIIANKTNVKRLGFDNENQVLGKKDEEILPKEVADRIVEVDKKVIEGNFIINLEEKITTKDNGEIYVSTTKVPMYDDSGEIVGLVGIGRDITEIKKYLNQLEESRQKLEILFNQSFQFVGLLTPEGILLEANKTACDFIGIHPDEVKNKHFAETPWWTHSKEEQDKLRQAIEFSASGNFYRMETTHYDKENNERIIDFSLTPIFDLEGKVIYLIAEGRDITEIRILQKRLTESEEKYRILVEASLDGIAIINPEGVILFENQRHKEFFKDVANDLISKNYFSLIYKADLEKFKLEIKTAYQEESSALITLRFIKRNSDFFWGELSIKTFYDSENQKLFMLVLRDITSKKQIEDELKKRVYELEKINKLIIGREVRMVELKKEVNSLLRQLGIPPKYSDEEF